MKKIAKIGMAALVAAAMAMSFMACNGDVTTSSEDDTTYEISGSATLTIKTDPSSTSDPAACKLGLFTPYGENDPSAASFTFTSFTIKVGETTYNKDVASLTFEKNGDYGWQFVDSVLNGTNFSAEDEVTVEFTGTSNFYVSSLQAWFVDNTASAGWWTELCDRVDMTITCVDPNEEQVK